MATLKSLGGIILDEAVTDGELRTRLFEEVPREELAAQVGILDEWVSGKKSDVFHGVVSRFSYLRQFAPAFLQALTFTPETESENPCLARLY